MKSSMILGLISVVAINAHLQRREPSHSQLNQRGVDISQYTMPDLSLYSKAVSMHETASLTARSDYVQTATELVKGVFPKLVFRLVEDYYIGTNGIGHVNFKQTVHGIDIDNADFHVNIGRDGKVFSYGNSFFNGTLPDEPSLNKREYSDPIAALNGAVGTLDLPIQVGPDAIVQGGVAGTGSNTYTITGVSGTVESPKARLVYFHRGDDHELKLSWRIETRVHVNWLLSYVDALTTSDVHGVVDYISDLATYEVYPWNTTNPDEGERVVLEDPWLLSASEFTWNSDGTTNYNSTFGNNALAMINPTGGSDYLNYYRPKSDELAFEYPYSLEELNATKYWDASITLLFHTANKYHDLLYVLGFTEAAGNFQKNNNGKGGKENDYVRLNAQSGLGMNNALFGSPPDGSSGEMFMFMFDRSIPNRDCSFEASVVIHEYTHGLSSRLTGGPDNAACLGGTESGSLGEGWSDFFAVATRVRPDHTRDTDQVVGAWVANSTAGVRLKPYSTNMETNNNTYATIDKLNRSHYRGEVWANMLYEVLWNMIDKHGKNDNDFPNLDENGKPDDGKFLTLKLVLDGLALQPCNPDFITARDGILDADLALTGGDNACQIWAGFAKRGMGPNAVMSPRTEDYEVPEGC